MRKRFKNVEIICHFITIKNVVFVLQVLKFRKEVCHFFRSFTFFPLSYHINKFKKTSQGFLCFPQLPHPRLDGDIALDISLTSRKCQALGHRGTSNLGEFTFLLSLFEQLDRSEAIELATYLRTCCTGRHIHQGSKVFHSTINTCINEYCPNKQWCCLASSLRRRRRRWQGRK